jgi:TorA maturation chaperone TorD
VRALTTGRGDEDPERLGGAATALGHLQEFVAEARGRPDLEAELEAEHTALFVLPSGVIPHEAFYLDMEQRLGGRVTIAVEQFYRRAGLPVIEHCIEMPDHLGLELEFMASLCRVQAEMEDGRDPVALQRCMALQTTFLEEHLSRWAFACCDHVVRQARYGLYKAIARFTTEFLRSEEGHLGIRHTQGARSCEPGPQSR